VWWALHELSVDVTEKNHVTLFEEDFAVGLFMCVIFHSQFFFFCQLALVTLTFNKPVPYTVGRIRYCSKGFIYIEISEVRSVSSLRIDVVKCACCV
jgi:hypothetical protein